MTTHYQRYTWQARIPGAYEREDAEGNTQNVVMKMFGVAFRARSFKSACSFDDQVTVNSQSFPAAVEEKKTPAISNTK